MNYQSDIKPLEDAGLSDADIASVLSSITVRPVPLWAFENFLDDEGLGRRDLSGKWVGILPEASYLPDPLGPGVATLFSHVNKLRAEQIDTTQRPWCLMAAQLLDGLHQAEIIAEAHREGFYALGGGLKHGTVTPEQVAVARDQHALNTYASELSQRIGGAVALAAAADGATEASIKAAAVAQAGA